MADPIVPINPTTEQMTARTNASPAVSTTLAQDQATAANQGKPGYDVLGGKISPTTISGDQSTKIADNIQKTNDINSGIAQNQAPAKNATLSGGFQYYGDGVTPITAPSDAIQQQDADGRSWYTSGGKNYAIGPDTGLSPEQQQSQDIISRLQSQSDSYFARAMASVKDAYDSLIAQQKQVNTGAEASTNTALIASGSGRYDPVTAGGFNQAQMSYGLQKISDLTAKEMSALSELNKAQMDKNYELADKTLTQINKIRDDKQAAAKKLQDDIAQGEKDARTFAETQRMNTLQEKIHNDTLSYQEKQQEIAKAQLSETSRHNIEQELVARETALKGVYNRDADGTIYDTRTGKVVSDPQNSLPIGSITIGHSGSPVVDANTKTTSTGVPYVDGTNLTGAEATKAQLKAAQLGIPYLSKDGSNAINNIEAARNDFSLIGSLVTKLNPNDVLNNVTGGFWRAAVSTVHGLENKLQVGPGATDLGSYNTFKESSIKAIQALAAGGTGLRINQAEIQTMMDNIPSYNDTKGVAQAKLSKLNAMLTNNEKGLIGTKYYDAYNPEAAKKDVDTYEGASPEHKTQIDALLKTNPNLTDGQIMQLVQP